MSIRKTAHADLHAQWDKTLNISLILAILLVTLIFRFSPEISFSEFRDYQVPPVEVITLIPITTQEKPAPAPVHPALLVVVPDDTPIGDDPIIQNTDPGGNEMMTAGLFSSDFNESEKDSFEVFENAPEPVGGISGIQKRVIYPELAIKAQIEGQVVIRAGIDEKGNVIKTDVLKGLPGGCTEAAITAIKNTRFSPGLQREKPVKVQIAIPVTFRLNK